MKVLTNERLIELRKTTKPQSTAPWSNSVSYGNAVQEEVIKELRNAGLLREKPKFKSFSTQAANESIGLGKVEEKEQSGLTCSWSLHGALRALWKLRPLG